MKRSTSVAHAGWSRFVRSVIVCGALVLGAATAVRAQAPPPVQGTVALEGTMNKVYRAANKVIVTTIDGVQHVYTFTKDLLVHGGKGSGVDALADLREGTTVVVHYTVQGAEESATEIDRIGDEGLKITEGVVTRIDRGKKQITIRFDNGKSETLRLTDQAAVDAGKDVAATAKGEKVIVYYSDEAGRKVAHYFKKAS